MQTKILLAIIATAVVAVALIGVTFALVSAQPQNSTIYSQAPAAPYSGNYGYYPPMYNNGTGIYMPYPQGTYQYGAPQGASPYGYGFGMGRGMCGRYW